MDWHSRYVLSWEISVTMDDSFCVSALERALHRYGRPEMFNPDQGVQYTGAAFTGALKEHDVKISMDGKGRAMDNIMIERLWLAVEYEEIYIKEFPTVEALIIGLRQYFKFYNHERPHATFGGRTPAEVYNGTSILRNAA
jgi:putative transposase